jgi:hypothetical protein
MPDFKNAENQALRRIIELALGKVRDDLEKSKEKLETETCKKLLQKLRTESPKQCHELLVAFIKRKLSFDTTKDGLFEYCESIQHKSGSIGRDPNGEGDFVKAFFEYKSYVAVPAVSHSSPQGNAVTDPTNGRQSRSSHQGASPSGTQPSNTTAASSAPCGQKDFEQLFSKVILRLRDDGVLGPDMDIELLDPLLAKELADTYSAHTDRSQTSGLFNKWLYQMDKHNSQDGHELCEAVLLVLQHWYQHAPSKVPLSWSTVKGFIDAYTEEARRDDLDPEFQVQVVFETGEVCTFPEYCRKQNPDANNSAGVSVDSSTSDQLPVATGSDQDAHGDTDDEFYSNGPDALKPVPQSANVETSTTVSISHPATSTGSTAQSSSVSTAGNTVNQPTTSAPQVAVPATHGNSTASKTTAFAASIPGLATLDGKPPPAQAPKIPTGAAPATRATASTLTGGISTAGANTATSTQNPTVTSPLPIQSAIRRTAIVSMWSTPSTPVVSNQSSIGSSYGDTDMTDPVASAAQPTKDGDVDMKDLEGSGQQAAPIRHLDGDVDMKDLEVPRQKATTRPSDGDADMEDLEGPRQKAAPTGPSDGDVDMKDPEGPRQKAAPTQSSDGDVNMKDPEGPLQEVTTLPSDDDFAMIDSMAPATTISDGSAPSIQSAGNQPSQNSPQPQSARATDLSPSPRKEISVFQISRNKNLRARKRRYGKGTQSQPSSPTSTRRTSSHSDTVLDQVSRIHKPYHFHWDRRRLYNKRGDVQQSDTDDEASRVPHGGDIDSADAAVEQNVDVPAEGNPAAEIAEPGQQVPNLPPDEAVQERDVSTVEAEDTQASTESVASSKPSGTPDVQAQLGEDQPEAPVVHKQASLAEAPVQEEVLSGTKSEPTPTTFNTLQGDTSVDSTENATTSFCEQASVPTEVANLQIAAEYQASSPVTNEPGVAISSPDHCHDQSSVGSSPGHLLRVERLAGSGYRHTFQARGRPVTWIDYPPVTVPEPRNDVSPAQFSLGYYSVRQRMNMVRNVASAAHLHTLTHHRILAPKKLFRSLRIRFLYIRMNRPRLSMKTNTLRFRFPILYLPMFLWTRNLSTLMCPTIKTVLQPQPTKNPRLQSYRRMPPRISIYRTMPMAICHGPLSHSKF